MPPGRGYTASQHVRIFCLTNGDATVGMRWLDYGSGLIDFAVGLLAWLAVVWALVYLLLPLWALFAIRYRRPLCVAPFDPSTEPMDDETRSHFDRTYRQLVPLGFELAGCVRMPPSSKNEQSRWACYANRISGEVAIAAFVSVSAAAVRVTNPVVDFLAFCTDGSLVETHNMKPLSPHRPLENEYVARFAEVQDVALLYRLHRFLVGKHCPEAPLVCRLKADYAGDVAAFALHSFERACDRMVTQGFLLRTAAAYRPSLLGAYRMTWRELWPVKPIRYAIHRRRADAILMEYYASQAALSAPTPTQTDAARGA